MSLADAVATAPRRQISGHYWHQGSTRHPLTSCADPARAPGRCHRTGEPGVWYASSQEQAAWAELFRHFVDDGVGDDYSTTQTIAAAARDAGFHAILAPAAALPDRETLAVFAHALPSVQAERSEIRQPPPRLADLLPLIRPHERVPDAVRRLYRTLARSGADAIRRRRRSDP